MQACESLPEDRPRVFIAPVMPGVRWLDAVSAPLSCFRQDLIRRMLIVDESLRLTARDAVNHPWLQTKGQTLAENDLGRNLEQLRIFNATRKLRAAIKSVRGSYRPFWIPWFAVPEGAPVRQGSTR